MLHERSGMHIAKYAYSSDEIDVRYRAFREAVLLAEVYRNNFSHTVLLPAPAIMTHQNFALNVRTHDCAQHIIVDIGSGREETFEP